MRKPLSWLARVVLTCGLGAVALTHVTDSSAQQRSSPVELRTVSAPPAPALAPTLRAAVEEALSSIDLGPRRAGYVIDVSVTKMNRQALAVGERIDCEVSVIVEETTRHSVRGVLTGRSHVVGDAADELEIAAVRAAARGALRSLPTAIGR